LLEFIRLFKQRTAFQFRKSHRRALWERSYYDHILRPCGSHRGRRLLYLVESRPQTPVQSAQRIPLLWLPNH
jgi:hypothetical protein